MVAEKFGRFVHALLLVWLGMGADSEETEDENKKGQSEALCLHLKELSASTMTGPTIVAHLSSQMV